MKFSPDKLPSEENSEISEHEWEALQEDADACMMLTKEHTPWSTVRSRSMHHILRNLEATPLLINFRRENGEKPNRTKYQELHRSLMAIRTYFQLLEDFPDFAEKEINTEEGYFPEKWNKFSLSEDFIEDYERTLRGEGK